MADISKIEINGAIFDLKDELIRYPSFVIADEKTLPISGEALSNQIGKIVKYLSDLKDFAYKNTLTFTDVTNALDYIPLNKEAYDEDMVRMDAKYNVAINRIYNEIVDKGSRPASKGIDDICLAIENIPTGGHYGVKEIREDGTYYPSDDGVDAYSLVIVSKDVGEPHTVIFYDVDGETILKTQANVPYHGNASCTLLDGKVINSQYFKGWNPSPTNITRDTQCYPIFGDYIIQSGEIEDDWDTICAKKGADYPLGSYKSLVINSFPKHSYGRQGFSFYPSYDGDSIDDFLNISGEGKQGINSIATQMYKVAEGEDGSTSTWLSSQCFQFSLVETDYYNSGMWMTYEDKIVGSQPWHGGRKPQVFADWGSSFLRAYLQDEFFSSFPTPLQNAIKMVNKSYTSISKQPITYNCIPQGSPIVTVEKTSLDKIWIPSYKEFSTLLNGKSGPGWHTAYKELNGIDYTSVYSPNYWSSVSDRNAKCLLRSIVIRLVNSMWMPYFMTITYNSGNLTGWDRSNETTCAPFGFCL